jgi:hypothetical protein
MPPGPNDVTVHLHNWLEAQVLHREAERALAALLKKAQEKAK